MHTRRSIIQGAGSLALATLSQPAWAAGGLDLSDRGDRLTALAKMRGCTDDRLIIGWVIGSRYAIVDHRAIPMLGILAGTFARYRRRDAETYEARTLEVAFFTDLDSGELLETWKNPVTGTIVDVPQTRLGPSTVLMTVDGLRVPNPSGEAFGMEIRHQFRPPVTHADQVWITEEIRVYGEARQAGAQPFVYNENTTYGARKSELDDPALAAVPVDVSFQSLVTYRPWMGFGDAPGHTMARGNGSRALKIDDLPPQYVRLVRAHHGDVLRDPLAALEAAADAA